MRRAMKGEKLTIGFFGGSITQGCLAAEHERAYSYRVFQWWKDTFPQAEISYVNGGIGGTTSYFGVSRIWQDLHLKFHVGLPSGQPDLPHRDILKIHASFRPGNRHDPAPVRFHRRQRDLPAAMLHCRAPAVTEKRNGDLLPLRSGTPDLHLFASLKHHMILKYPCCFHIAPPFRNCHEIKCADCAE